MGDKETLIDRDKKVLGLKNCEISEVYVGDLKLDQEFENYNAEILENTEVTVMQGIDKEGKKNILYYYMDDFDTVRQMRIFNQYGDIESMSRQAIFSDGRCEHIDDAVIVYQYDKHGNKKIGLYQDDIEGMRYFEYGKEGNIVLTIGKEYIGQKIEENGNTYMVYDGYFKPLYNGFECKPTQSMTSLNPEDMQRVVCENVPSEIGKALMNGMDTKRKEEVLNTLRAVEPIFESCKIANPLDETNIKKMQKFVGWFTSFAKRLELNPKLAVQDEAVMSAMRTAVGKTVGNTRNVEMELKTPIKEEIKEKEIGNN